jgi:hypothetical protein
MHRFAGAAIMFALDRIFSQRDPGTGLMEWYFDAREGLMGPYRTEGTGRKALEAHLEHCRRCQLDGGRRLGLRAPRLELAHP